MTLSVLSPTCSLRLQAALEGVAEIAGIDGLRKRLVSFGYTKTLQAEIGGPRTVTHMLHGSGILFNICPNNDSNVGKYANGDMEPVGYGYGVKYLQQLK